MKTIVEKNTTGQQPNSKSTLNYFLKSCQLFFIIRANSTWCKRDIWHRQKTFLSCWIRATKQIRINPTKKIIKTIFKLNTTRNQKTIIEQHWIIIQNKYFTLWPSCNFRKILVCKGLNHSASHRNATIFENKIKKQRSHFIQIKYFIH